MHNKKCFQKKINFFFLKKWEKVGKSEDFPSIENGKKKFCHFIMKIVTFDHIGYALNVKEKTAKVIFIRINAKRDIIIPHSITMNSEEYVVTKIAKRSFSFNRNIRSLKFSNDTEIQEIESKAFELCSIREIIIPPSMTKLNTGCFHIADQLTKVSVMPNNPVLMSIDDKIICKKSSIEKVDFDVLVFCIFKIDKVTIPNFIEVIGISSFENCELQSIEFPPDSKLRIIENNAFESSKLKSINIPPHLTKICFEAFHFSYLEKIDIPDNSELQIIEPRAFSDSKIEKIKIPLHLTKICESVFRSCRRLKTIEISENCELESIEKDAFICSSIESLLIPPKLTDLQSGWCSGTKD